MPSQLEAKEVADASPFALSLTSFVSFTSFTCLLNAPIVRNATQWFPLRKSFTSNINGAFMLLITAERRPSFPRSPTARAPDAMTHRIQGPDGRNCGARGSGNVRERSVPIVVIENLRLKKTAAKTLAIDFGINMAVDEQQVGPAIVVHVEKHRAPAEILRV